MKLADLSQENREPAGKDGLKIQKKMKDFELRARKRTEGRFVFPHCSKNVCGSVCNSLAHFCETELNKLPTELHVRTNN